MDRPTAGAGLGWQPLGPRVDLRVCGSPELAGRDKSGGGQRRLEAAGPGPRRLARDGAEAKVVETRALSNATLERAAEARRTIDSAAYSNGRVRQPVPWSDVVVPGDGAEDVVCWVPEVIFNATEVGFMPCPRCGPVGNNVISIGWGGGDSSLLAVEIGNRLMCILSQHYACSRCDASFRGWHLDAVSALPERLASRFPVARYNARPDALERLNRIEQVVEPTPVLPASRSNSLASYSANNSGGVGVGALAGPPADAVDDEELMDDLWDSFSDENGTSASRVELGGGPFGNIEPLPGSEMLAALDFVPRQFSLGSSWSMSSSAEAGAFEAPRRAQQELSGGFPFDSKDNMDAQGPPRLLDAQAEGNSGSLAPVSITSSADSSVPGARDAQGSSLEDIAPTVMNELQTDPEDSTMAAACLTSSKRSIQFCSVCFGVRRQRGKLVDGHKANGFCPVKGRKATTDEKRELRRRRQKMRRAMTKHQGTISALLE